MNTTPNLLPVIITLLAVGFCVFMWLRSRKPAAPVEVDLATEVAAAIKAAVPQVKATRIVNPKEIEVILDDDRKSTAFLDNTMDRLSQAPDNRQTIINDLVNSVRDALTMGSNDSLRDNIVLIIKDLGWVKEMPLALAQQNPGGKPIELLHLQLNEELAMVYAEDTPKSLRYLSPEDVKQLGLEYDELRALAINNLRQRMPTPQIQGADGLYGVTNGGNFEACLLLLEEFWSNETFAVDGDLVVAVPARDLLFITGSRDARNIAKLRSIIAAHFDGWAYRLTPALFIRREGGSYEVLPS